jgi:hypothetical protein
MKHLTKVVLTWIAFGAFFFTETDTYKRLVHPEKYWSKQVKALESGIAYSESELKNVYLERQKLERTANLTIAQEVNEAVSIGGDPEKARASAIREVDAEYEVLDLEAEVWIKQIEASRKELDNAKAELAKHVR